MSSLNALLDVVVLTLDEAANLPGCLESVPPGVPRWIVDSGSTDRTQEVARQLGCTVVEHEWAGFAGQRNAALAKCGDRPWVLFIDADEVYPAETFEELERILPAAAFDVAAVPSRLVWRGKQLNHAPGYPILHARVVRRGSAHFVPIRGHAEAVVTSRPIHQMTTPYRHHIYDGDSVAWLNKHLRLAVAEALAPTPDPGLGTARAALSRRARFGVLRVPMRFLFHFVLSRGFLDGARGLEYSLFYAWFDFTTQLARRSRVPTIKAP